MSTVVGAPVCECCHERPATYEGKFVLPQTTRPGGVVSFGNTVRYPLCGPCIPACRDGGVLVHGGTLSGLEGLPESNTTKRKGKVKATDTVHYRCMDCRLSRKGEPGRMFCDDCGGELREIGYVQKRGRRRR